MNEEIATTPTVSPETIGVGSLVQPKNPNYNLVIGCSGVNKALVVSISPFVLTTIDADYTWDRESIQDFKHFATASAEVTKRGVSYWRRKMGLASKFLYGGIEMIGFINPDAVRAAKRTMDDLKSRLKQVHTRPNGSFDETFKDKIDGLFKDVDAYLSNAEKAEFVEV